MAVKLFITIDVEEDQWGEYRISEPTVDNVDGIPRIQDLFDRFGATPTYLINYPVLQNGRASRIFQKIHDRGRCEIGTHCHPWNTPPFDEEIDSVNSMLCNLPYELIYKKVENVHHEIVDRLGTVPICFRAGRWGFDSNVAKCIGKLGYRIDTSVTPLTDWGHESGPDFSNASGLPYWFSADGIITDKCNGVILEVPVSIGFLQKGIQGTACFRKWIVHAPFRRHPLGLLEKLNLINLRYLSPELSTGSDMIRLAESLIGTGHSFLNMSFHSGSLLPGGGPFIRNDHELTKLLNNISTFLEFASKNGVVFSALKSALEDVDE